MTAAIYQREQVVDIINSVLVRVKAPNELSRESLTRELTDLKDIIEKLRSDLHAARPGDISTTHVPSATDELDAVVNMTEQATVSIMDSCDVILNTLQGADPQVFSNIEKCVIGIFEACTFQDITSQRIRKVMSSLKQIDHKTKTILCAIEGQLMDLNHHPSPAEANDDGDVPMHGPALPANAVSQDEIDRILAEFDNKKED